LNLGVEGERTSNKRKVDHQGNCGGGGDRFGQDQIRKSKKKDNGEAA